MSTETIKIALPRERTCAALARRHIEACFEGRFNAEAMSDLKLITSELVDNAYLHGEGQIMLSVELSATAVRVEVVDEGEGAAIEVRAAGAAGGGYGLQLVEKMCRAWGAFEGTTHVWAELGRR